MCAIAAKPYPTQYCRRWSIGLASTAVQLRRLGRLRVMTRCRATGPLPQILWHVEEEAWFPAVPYSSASPSSLFQYVQRYRLIVPARIMAGRSLRAHPYDVSVRGRSHDRHRPSLPSPSRVLRPVFHPPTPPKAPTVPRLRKIAACSSMHAMFVPRHRTVARAHYRGIPAM
jgi:hypothetical protein